MKKWYFAILITAFTALVVMQQHTVVPNQEIVLEFVDREVTSLNAQKAIANVKKQLQSIGVKYTLVSKGSKNGTLKIKYYSDADVTFIKEILSTTQNIALDHIFYDQSEGDHQNPLPKNSKEYNLDVYQIQKSVDFDRYLVVEHDFKVKHIQDSSASVGAYGFSTSIDKDNLDKLLHVAHKVYHGIAIAIDTTSQNTPEVRAGPVS